MSDPIALLKNYHAALNAFDVKKVEGLFAEDASYFSPGLHGEIKGRVAIMHAMATYFSEYADQVSTDENIAQLDANSVRSIWKLTATSTAGVKINRGGEEIIHFNIKGLIERVEVIDYLGN